MRVGRSLLVMAIALAAGLGSLQAQSLQPIEPIDATKLPYLEIFSPTFFWSDEVDFVRVGSTTCPKGRAINGGINIIQGKASLRVLESYPDGESWVMRVVNRQKPDTVQSLQARGYALCMLPAARKGSVLLTQHPKLLHVSTRFGVPSGFASTSGRQACPQGALPISGGFGLDPDYRGPASLRAELSFPDPNGWNVRAVNGTPAASPQADARAYAICLGNKEGVDIHDLKTVYFVTADVAVKPENGTARQAVSCQDQGSYVLGGGARTIKGRSPDVEIQESFPDTPSSWTVAVTNRAARRGGDATVRLYAVCLKK